MVGCGCVPKFITMTHERGFLRTADRGRVTTCRWKAHVAYRMKAWKKRQWVTADW